MSYKKILDTLDDLVNFSVERNIGMIQKRQELAYLLEHTKFNDEQLEAINTFVEKTFYSYVKERDAVAGEWFNPKHMRLREYSEIICWLSSYAVGFGIGTGFSELFMLPQHGPPVLWGSLTGLASFVVYCVCDMIESFDSNEVFGKLSHDTISAIYMHKFRMPEVKYRADLKKETLVKLEKENNQEATGKYIFMLPNKTY